MDVWKEDIIYPRDPSCKKEALAGVPRITNMWDYAKASALQDRCLQHISSEDGRSREGAGHRDFTCDQPEHQFFFSWRVSGLPDAWDDMSQIQGCRRACSEWSRRRRRRQLAVDGQRGDRQLVDLTAPSALGGSRHKLFLSPLRSC